MFKNFKQFYKDYKEKKIDRKPLELSLNYKYKNNVSIYYNFKKPVATQT